MTTRRIISLYILFLLPMCLFSQVLPSEKLFFISDKVTYEQGDSALIEGKVMRSDNDSIFRPYGKYVYIELANATDSVLTRQKLVCDSTGNFTTSIPIESFWDSGVYCLRAYTKVMTNFSYETFPIHLIQIGNAKTSPHEGEELHCQFYPEGGHLVSDHPQNIGIKLNDEYGNPLQLDYCLLAYPNDTLYTQSTTHNGWQVIRFAPQTGKEYYIETNYKGKQYKISLPIPSQAPTLQLIKRKNSLICKVLGTPQKGRKIYVYHQTTGLLEYPDEQKEIIMYTDQLTSGLVTVFLSDNDEIIAQASQWIDSNISVEPILNNQTFQKEEAITIKWTKDFDQESSVLVRIIPKQEKRHTTQAETMYNFECELRSDEIFPQHKTQKEDLEGWLYSASFKRFNLLETLEKGFSYDTKAEHSMVIQGYASTPYGKRMKKGNIVIYRKSDGKVFEGNIHENGYFNVPIEDFEEKDMFFIQAYSAKGKADFYTYDFHNDTLPSMLNWKGDISSEVNQYALTSHWGIDKINQMPEVIVKARVQTDEIKSTKEFYMSRYISEEVMDKKNFRDFKQLTSYFFPYMVFRESNEIDLKVTDRVEFEDECKLLSRRGASTLTGGKGIEILLDGVRITAKEARDIPMATLATAEYLTPIEASAIALHPLNGALVLTTKNYKEPIIKSKGAIYTHPFGLSNLNRNEKKMPILAPKTEGEYTIYIDLLSPQYGIRSYEYDITVVDD